MLTEEARRERKWGSFPALRQALEKKTLSSTYYGIASDSDNFFESFQRSREIGLLAADNPDSICEAAQTTGWDAMHLDLERLAGELQWASQLFQEEARRTQKLHSLEQREPRSQSPEQAGK